MTESQKRRPGRPPGTGRGETPGHNVRMPSDRWQRFGDATQAAGTDRTEAFNEFAAWYTHEPGAKRPTRPPAPREET